MVIRDHPNSEAQIGDTLIYVLRPEERPTNSAQRWRGTVKRILIDMDNRPQQIGRAHV